MKIATKIIILLIFAALALSLNFSPLLAEEKLNLTNSLKNVGTNAGYASGSEDTLSETIGKIIRAILSLLGIVFMSLIVYGGYLWMTARGNEEKLEKAKAIIRGSIIGLVIVLASYAITAFVIDRVGLATSYKQ